MNRNPPHSADRRTTVARYPGTCGLSSRRFDAGTKIVEIVVGGVIRWAIDDDTSREILAHEPIEGRQYFGEPGTVFQKTTGEIARVLAVASEYLNYDEDDYTAYSVYTTWARPATTAEAESFKPTESPLPPKSAHGEPKITELGFWGEQYA